MAGAWVCVVQETLIFYGTISERTRAGQNKNVCPDMRRLPIIV